MENTNFVKVPIELDAEHLDYIKRHNIDLDKFCQDLVDEMINRTPKGILMAEIADAKKRIEESTKRLEQAEKELSELIKNS